MSDNPRERVLLPINVKPTLPTNVVPTHYTLTITPDFSNFTFKGIEEVNLNVNEISTEIILHAIDIDIRSVRIVNSVNQSFWAVNTNYDIEKQTVKFGFPQELAAKTTATLHIEYTGSLNDRMIGFHRSSYQDGKTTKYLAVTQFEATYARRAFPSWDEPAFKATFDITLIVPSNMTVLSNMGAYSEDRLGDGKKEVKFGRTPKMSTYIVAFVVGEFGYIEASTSGVNNNGKSVTVRVYAPKGEERHGEFALSVAVKALEYFAKVFGIPYPLPKCDMVAIPDFEAGAMENWGLIIYSTTAIFFDSRASDVRYKQRIAYTVCHELAHQWFGNLVTMEWWTHLWLNEGFATWVGYHAVDTIFPDWEIWNQYVTEGYQRGLLLDSLKSSHPIEVPVNDPREIHQIFDAISYHKGANVIRMTSAFLGEDRFLSGVKQYLKKFEYGNASTDDLWKALAETSGNAVGQFMTIWTKVVGHPVITVEEQAPNTLKIRQCRFLSSGAVSSEEEDNTIWWVPLGVDLGPDTPDDLRNVVLTRKEMTLRLPENNEFYQFNVRKTGVFRVNYTPERLSKLGKAAKQGLLETSDRIGVIADAGALAASGYGKTSGLLSLIKGFVDEDRYIVWLEINNRLAVLLNVWFEQPEPIYQGLLKFQRQLVSKLVSRLGWEYLDSDTHLTAMLRTLVIRMAGRADDEDTVREAYRRFRNFTKRNDESAIHPNLRGVVFEIVLSHGGSYEEFDAILKYYHEARTVDQKMIALTGLGYTTHDGLIQRALKFSISEEVRNQDIIYAFFGLQSNRKSRRQLWNFIKENWYLIHDRYARSIVLFENIIKLSIELLSSEEDIEDIERFFANKNCKNFEKPLQQSIESVRANADWLKRDSQDVEDWLRDNGYLTGDKK